MRETGRSGYKAKLKEKLEDLFPGCLIMHNSPADTHQGIPDMTVIYGGSWGMLEAKASRMSAKQPNQEYWVEHYNQLSFASFIYPENEEEVLNALQAALASSGNACHSKP